MKEDKMPKAAAAEAGPEFGPDDTLSLIIYGEPGVGKTPIAMTAPGPTLVLDVEGRTKFVQGRKVRWDPERDAPPEADGSWDYCVVQVRTWKVAKAALDWVIAGKHTFRSVVVDSITELQKRARDTILAGSNDTVLSERLWGILLSDMEKTIRDLRDSTTHPTAPIQVLVMTATAEMRDGRFGPFVQGGLVKSLPGLVDVIGYLDVEDGVEGPEARKMLIGPHSQIRAKDASSELPGGGVTGHYGSVLRGPINLAEIVSTIYQ